MHNREIYWNWKIFKTKKFVKALKIWRKMIIHV